MVASHQLKTPWQMARMLSVISLLDPTLAKHQSI